MARSRKGIWRRRARLVVLAGVAILLLLIAYEAATWPDVRALSHQAPATTAFIERARARGVEVRWHWVGYDLISDDLKQAVLVAEDINFFSHKGLDTYELGEAVREAVSGQRVRGASTITQQVAKNLWLSPSRSPLRKVRELVLTWQLERTLGKRRILEIYLNVAEMGPGVFGVETASRRYFGVSAVDLNASQAAQLAASLPRPSTWHPGSPSRGYAQHVARIRRRMERADWLFGCL